MDAGKTMRRGMPACASILAGLSVFVQLAACGGGGGAQMSSAPPVTQQPPPPPPPAPPPPVVTDAEGLWSGTMLSGCDLYGVSLLVTREGWLFAGTPRGLYVGSLASGRLTAVNYRGTSAATSVIDARMDADTISLNSVRAQRTLTLTWSGSAPNFCTQTFSDMVYDPLYERPASMAIVSGVYTDGDLTLAVNSDGVVTGSDVYGCVFNGIIAAVHADRNYYSVTIDVGNCPGSGRFEGAAFLDDTEAGIQNQVLRLVAANPEHALWLWLQK